MRLTNGMRSAWVNSIMADLVYPARCDEFKERSRNLYSKIAGQREVMVPAELSHIAADPGHPCNPLLHRAPFCIISAFRAISSNSSFRSGSRSSNAANNQVAKLLNHPDMSMDMNFYGSFGSCIILAMGNHNGGVSNDAWQPYLEFFSPYDVPARINFFGIPVVTDTHTGLYQTNTHKSYVPYASLPKVPGITKDHLYYKEGYHSREKYSYTGPLNELVYFMSHWPVELITEMLQLRIDSVAKIRSLEKVRTKLQGIANSVTTTDALAKELPEFAHLLPKPEKPQSRKTALALSSPIEDMRALGWKPKVAVRNTEGGDTSPKVS